MKPVNVGGHAAYQDRVLSQLRKYYPDAASFLPSHTWDIMETFWNLDLSDVDSLMQDRYSVFGPAPRLPSDMLRTVHLVMKDNPRLFNEPPRSSKEWKVEFNARTSSERCNKRQKIDYKLEDGRYRSSKMWYCRLFAIMMCQHLDAWALPKTSRLKDLFKQAD